MSTSPTNTSLRSSPHHTLNDKSPRNWLSNSDPSGVNTNKPAIRSPSGTSAPYSPYTRTVKPTSRTSISTSSRSDSATVSRVQVDTCFREAGYIPISSITMSTPNGSSERVLIEALNPLGSTVMVETDDAEINIEKKYRGTIIGSTNRLTPATKDRNFSLVHPDTRGVAIFCMGEMCVVSGDTLSPEEKNVSVTRNNNGSVLDDRTIRPVPIVRLNDIVVNRDAVLKGTEKANARLVSNSAEGCHSILRAVDGEFREMHTQLKRFYTNADTVTEYLKVESDDIRSELDKMARSLPISQEKKDERHELMRKMGDMECMHFELLRLCSALDDMAARFEEISNTMNEVNVSIEEKMKTLSIL